MERSESGSGFDDVAAVQRRRWRGERYLADRGARDVGVPGRRRASSRCCVEGEAGVGKTEVAKALAAATGARLIRLQCHEGIDLHHALYDWDYPRQLLAIRAAEAGGRRAQEGRFSREFLLRRPLLEALEHDGAGRPADRRDRPRRRRVRGVPARVPLGLPGHDPRARHGRRARAGRSSSSPRTARASCTTRSSAAASTTGSTTPTPEREAAIVHARAARRARRDRRARVRRGRAAARPARSTSCPGVGETIAWAQALLALDDRRPRRRRSASR